MAKYKLLNSIGWDGWDLGFEINTEQNINGISLFKVRDFVKYFPKDWELVPELTEDELLLNEAKRRYPMGTRFNSTGGNINIRIKETSVYVINPYSKDIELWDHGYLGTIYSVGLNRWAEIIKEETMSTEKKIIGYKLKDNLWENEFRKNSFIKGACLIGVIHGDTTIENINESTTIKFPAVIDNFKAAGVLDLWFEPVYKSTYPEITVNGFRGEFFDGYVKFGCAEIHKQLFLDLYAVKGSTLTNGREINSVTIGKGTFTKDQIKEIAEYYLQSK